MPRFIKIFHKTQKINLEAHLGPQVKWFLKLATLIQNQNGSIKCSVVYDTEFNRNRWCYYWEQRTRTKL